MWCKVLLAALFFQASDAHQFFGPEDEYLQFFVPTVKSSNQLCQNHSIFYVEELKQLKLWATEMFDASGKMPIGVSFGAGYNFGNFDQCLSVRVPSGKSVVGKYCLADFHLNPPDSLQKHNSSQSYNATSSIWEKIIAISSDKSRLSRSDYRLAYCLPSTCSPEDLEESLKEVAKQFSGFSNVKVTVDPLSCQTQKDYDWNVPDMVFLSVVGVFVLVALTCSAYDLLLKFNNFKHLQLKTKKHNILFSFSIYSNLKKLGVDSNDDLKSISGIKVLSMAFIIMGHRFMFGLGSPLLNPREVEKYYNKVEASVLLNGPIIVDTFFTISGFLVCYLLLIQLDKTKRPINFPFLLIHRFIRLTPPYAIVVAFYCTIFVSSGSGPLWPERIQVEQERCLASWWANIFYVNNYANKEQICMFQSWYLTCDMQLFMIAPFIIWLIRKKPYIGVASLLLLVLLGISAKFATIYVTHEDAILLLYMKFLRDPVVDSTFKNVYIPTHMRATPFFIGIMAGFVKYQIKKQNYSMSKRLVYAGWILSVVVLEITVYSAFVFYVAEKAYDPLLAAVYGAMHHVTWSISISWMILALSEGNGAWVEPILAWKPFVVLSKLTYCAFLCHGAVQMYSAAILRSPNYASIFNLLVYTSADLTLSYFFGLCLSMFFEAPILGLEKIILRRSNEENEDLNPHKPRKVTPKIKILNQF